MKNYKIILSLAILTVSTVAVSQISQARAPDKHHKSRCRAAHKECDSVLNLYMDSKTCHKHVEKCHGCAAEEIIVAPSATGEEIIVAPPATTVIEEEISVTPAPAPAPTLPAEEITTTTDTVDTDFGGIQGEKGFRNAIEGI